MKEESVESLTDGHGRSYHYCGSCERQVKKGRNVSPMRKSFWFHPGEFSFRDLCLDVYELC